MLPRRELCHHRPPVWAPQTTASWLSNSITVETSCSQSTSHQAAHDTLQLAPGATMAIRGQWQPRPLHHPHPSPARHNYLAHHYIDEQRSSHPLNLSLLLYVLYYLQRLLQLSQHVALLQSRLPLPARRIDRVYVNHVRYVSARRVGRRSGRILVGRQIISH